MLPTSPTVAAGQPAHLAGLLLGAPVQAPRPALTRCRRGCTGGRLAIVRLCEGPGRCPGNASPAEADDRANLPQPLVLEYPLLDWSAAVLGDRAKRAAFEADAAGVPMCWITERRR